MEKLHYDFAYIYHEKKQVEVCPKNFKNLGDALLNFHCGEAYCTQNINITISEAVATITAETISFKNVFEWLKDEGIKFFADENWNWNEYFSNTPAEEIIEMINHNFVVQNLDNIKTVTKGFFWAKRTLTLFDDVKKFRFLPLRIQPKKTILLKTSNFKIFENEFFENGIKHQD